MLFAPVAVEETARAKVNLSLRITGKRGDGLHLLDSIVVFADLCDRVILTPASKISLFVKGPFAAGAPPESENIVLAAHEMLKSSFPRLVPPVKIDLEKHIPIAAGLGGGSSDAAATLRALCSIGGISVKDPAVARTAAALGADVSVCLAAAPARMRGIGDECEALGPFGQMRAVLAMPGRGLSTAEVYARYDRHPNVAGHGAPGNVPHRITLEWLKSSRNDLQEAAEEIVPEISELCHALADRPGAYLARMSGSGTACFALFQSAEHAQEAAGFLAAAHPGWWFRSVVLNAP